MKYDDIRGILRYVPQFRGQTFVVLIDSGIIEHENMANVMLDLAVLHSLSIRLVVVFGARHQIAELARKRGVPLSNSDATGVTDDVTLEVALDAISRLTTNLMQQLTVAGLRAGVSNAVMAHPAGVIRGRDLGSTGTVDRVETKVLKLFIDEGVIPIVPPLGYERQGRVLRINSAATAVDTAIALGASKLLFVGPGAIEDSQGARIRQLSVEEAKALADQAPEGVDSLKYVQIRHAARACEGGVPRAHFLDGRTDDALLGELFSIEGVGTMIYADAYQQIRAARRMDVPGIMQLVKRAVDDEELVSRSRHEIRESLGDYFVLEVDGQIVGTVSVHSYPEEKLAEVGFLYIKRTHEGMGFGRKLVSFAERRARAFGAKTIFALSTQAYNFFENKLGFLPADDALLPPDRLEKLRKSGRNSRLMAKVLRG
ncbi:MAG: amino-acid N-acetyltransferase [Verrucomicrobiales bacterium]|nr:amino-acid N-acetyltransferase [Verrucomicrobiales bacterium]